VPEIFGGHDDGLYYVKEVAWPSILDDGAGPQEEPIYQMSKGTAAVPEPLLEATIEAAEECPGECIFIDFD
jgi:ferredoxin